MKKSFVALLALASFLTFGAPTQAAVDPLIGDGYDYKESSTIGGFAAYGFNSAVDAKTSALYSFALDSGTFTNGQMYVGSGSSFIMTYLGSSQTLSLGDLVLSLAWNGSGGSVQVLNATQKAAYLSLALFGSTVGASTLTSQITASAVPLPAALPLFGLGIASLAGFAARRKQAKAA